MMELQIQSVIYGNKKEALLKAISALKQTVQVYHKKVGELKVSLVYGDASPNRIFSEEDVRRINENLNNEMEFQYRIFGFNSGTAKGHNLMGENCTADFMMIMNPDVILEPQCLTRMLMVLKDPKVGLAEARQTPLEHAKEYDIKNVSASKPFISLKILVLKTVHAVDAHSVSPVFMYCDDLDFSWRIRLAGYKIIYVPSAIAYHAIADGT